MHDIRDAIREVFARLDLALNQPELPEPSRRPLLDPAAELLAGDLVVVASRHRAEAVDVLFRVACDVAPARDVVLVVDRYDWAMTNLLSVESGMPLELLTRERLTRKEYEHLVDVAKYVKAWGIDVLETVKGRDPIKETTEWLCDHPGGVAFILSSLVGVHDAQEELIARFVRRLKTSARTGNGTVALPWLLGSNARDGRRPELKHLVGSGALEDDADEILLIGHNDDGEMDEIRLAKNRHGQERTLWSAYF